MSYAASLLANYPSSYGQSGLLSDDLIQRTTLDNLYQPAVPYMSSGRLLSDDLAFNNQINYDSTIYRPSLYLPSNPTSVYPTTKNRKPLAANQHKVIPPNNSFNSFNDITEYSDSLATASNTNTASSVARSINGPTNMFANRNPLFSNGDYSPPVPRKTKPNEIKTKSMSRSQPSINTQKKSSVDQLDDDLTPVQSPQQANHLHKNRTITEKHRQSPAVDIQAWVNGTEKRSPTDEKAAQQAWSMKIDQLHHAQAQREKEKTKPSRLLPIPPKKLDSKPTTTTKTKSIADTSYQLTSDSYFDALFDGDYFRKSSTIDHPVFSLHHATTKGNNATISSYSNSNANSVLKNPKYVPPRKTPRYEPPTSKRAPPTITTTSWRTQWPRHYQYDSLYPYHLYHDLNYHDYIHKDTDERFREALQKVRADRAEQQQKEVNEKTAKRLHYGDYVRHATKDTLLQNAIKPSPWSDFMDLKKGNLYSLSKEEKKRLYNQSKSYGERVRYRNFAAQYANETTQSQRHSVPLMDDFPEHESGNATPRQPASKSVTDASKRPDSASTNKSHTKPAGGNRLMPNQISRTNARRDQSKNSHRSDDEYENYSDHETNRKSRQKSKQKNVRYAKFDSSGRPTSGTEESDSEVENHTPRNARTRDHDANDDLYTVREEKTLESFENARYKKR